MCRENVTSFQVVPIEVVEDLYAKIGGVPRYVLERPMKELTLVSHDIEAAKVMACDRLVQALNQVNNLMMLMQLFAQGKDTLDFSSRLIHRWPTSGHRNFRLEWASTYVAENIAGLLSQEARYQMLQRLVMNPNDSARGIMFEAYVLRIFREGGYTFEIKDLSDGTISSLSLPANPETKHFNTIPSVQEGTLCIPKISNYACVDMLPAHKLLFQITVSKDHPIKGPPLSKLLDRLIEAQWISTSDEPWLIFVVPSEVYADFKIQHYVSSSDEKVYKRLPAELKRVRQYVLKIDLESAVAGRSPGLQIPMRQNAETLG
ncbi:hypothetical protein BGW42_001478 [Actinomortierella wolfii]|nr:hypothetical protein BGW42_001478 [Actinomortierella wolfii]